MTHGSKNHRAPGSIGMGTTPGRVLPGKKMAGQLGNKITTIKKLKVIQINTEENILVIKGSVPGKPGNLLSIVTFIIRNNNEITKKSIKRKYDPSKIYNIYSIRY